MQRGYKKHLVGRDNKEKFEIYQAENVDELKTKEFSADKKKNGSITLNIITKNNLATKTRRYPISSDEIKTSVSRNTLIFDQEKFISFVQFLNQFESCIR